MSGHNPHIVVAGSGLVGLAMAAKLARAQYQVTLTGETPPTFDDETYGLRVYALNETSCNLLEQIGVWEEIKQQRVYPYSSMYVWDQEKAGELEFHSTDIGTSRLGVIAEDTLLRNVLFQFLQKQPQVNICCPARVVEVEEPQHGTHRITLSDQRVLTAHLLVGADGARSWVRQNMDVFWKYTDYRQSAVVATVQHHAPYGDACWQRFYQHGVLALLPLSKNLGSIVWTCDRDLAANLMKVSAEEFTTRLQTCFQDRLGEITRCSERAAFPLFGGRVNRYVRGGYVLLGDAAHHIHPLAGQGANMGLADVAMLADVLADGEMPNVLRLRKYERAVKARNFATKVFLEGLNSIFTARHPLLRKGFCLYGMNTVNRCLPIKRWFMRQASGVV